MNVIEIGKRARAATRLMARATGQARAGVLFALAEHLVDASDAILEANQIDVQQGRRDGLTPAMLDRLTINPSRLAGMAADLRSVAALADPVGEIFDETVLPNGLQVHKQRVPLGVLGVIYEARPNVTIDVAGLAIKTANTAILRGGSETINTNRILVKQVQMALAENGLPPDAIQFIDDTDRGRVLELLQMHEYVDLLIPRGGAGLHQYCRENSRIPVITGGIGVCHLYVDETADLEAALTVIQNAKVQRPTVCNALDTVLVHQEVASEFLAELVKFLEKDGVMFKADPVAMEALRLSRKDVPASVSPASKADFNTEWLSLVLGLKVVAGMDEAIEHIARYSTGHSDGILTQDQEHARQFVAEVDSAAVYVNASTRFTDGAQLGLGAEVAISTQRLHARGPMGLRELTTYKWVIHGEYHVRKG
jgi:glutamate-5-semialdehyde dehydrogenase